MATREKTVIFATQSLNTVATDAVVTNLQQITIYIPESSPTFVSVFVELAWRDVITATGGTITEHRVGLRLGAAGYTTFTELDDVVNTGENMGGIFGPIDFTTHFNTNWTGTSMTCDIQAYFDQNTGTTQGMINISAKVYITYQYDDGAATQIKTVRIPFESRQATLPTTPANFGTTQIPAMNTFLPESGVTIRDYFFVIEGNESNANTTDWTLTCDIGGADQYTFGLTETALQSDVFMRWIYKPTAIPNQATTHNFRLWSASTGRANHITVTLYVTYEFTVAGTTRILNSIVLPFELASPLGASGTTDNSRFTREIIVTEPGTITLRQSAFRVNYNLAASANHTWRAGSQDYLTYTGIANMACGMYSVQHRIDSGAVQGAGMTLDRGLNTITIDGYGSSTANDFTNIGGYVVLNYESDIPTQGIGTALHTVYKLMRAWDALAVDLLTISNWSFSIPESDYYITGAGFCLIQWQSVAANAITFDVQVLSGESKGAGYLDIYADAFLSDSERGCTMAWARGRDIYKRFPQDADSSRIDLETARNYRVFSPSALSTGIISCITYHSMTWNVAGNITGADPAQSTNVKLFRASNDELWQETTLAAGITAFDFTVYDNSQDYYVVARQDDTLVGRSGNSVAS